MSQIARISKLNQTKFRLSECIVPYITSDFTIQENQTIVDARGQISIFQLNTFHFFEVKRVFTLHNIPKGGVRGGHAHKKCKQYLIALSGVCKLNILTSVGVCSIILDTPNYGVLIETGRWIYQEDFSADCVIMVLASEDYEPEDYIFDLPEVFLLGDSGA